MADGKFHQHRACPRCGEDVEYGFGGPHAGAGVQMCIGCGAEVSFPSNPRDRGGRIVLADLAVPSQSGASPTGKHSLCEHCGGDVPLRGLGFAHSLDASESRSLVGSSFSIRVAVTSVSP